MTLRRSGNDLYVKVNATGQEIRAVDHFATAYWGIEKVEFADGSSWDLAAINANAWIRGTTGNDTLNGGSGNDTFVFHPGFGADSITTFGDSGSHQDVIEFSTSLFADFAAVQAASAQVGADVLITASATDIVTLKNFNLANLGADDFRFT